MTATIHELRPATAPATERDYSSPYDDFFDQFHSAALTIDEGRVAAAEFTQNKTLSWAAKKAADAAFYDDGNNRVRNPNIRTNVFGSYRFGWSKEEKGYVLSVESLTKMAACLEAHGYTVQVGE